MGVFAVTQVRICSGAEKKHAPFAALAITALESLPCDKSVLISNAGDPAAGPRRGDLHVTLERSDRCGIERIGAGGIALSYSDPAGAGPLAALTAASRPAGAPVLADPGSLALLVLADRLAKSDIPVLIGGPTGTGKEVLSRFIHKASDRREGPFIAVNCAAIPESMLEAMLFGHRKGSFTGAAEAAEGFFRAADGGTLLLDEVAEVPLGLQAKLLRALQEGEVVPIGSTKPVKIDVRIIACANRDLPQEVAEGRFREDLFYRLNVFPLTLPALRERPSDIAPLAFAMVLRHTPQTGSAPWISEEALAKLYGHTWPGNVRELENVIRRALLLAGNVSLIDADHILFDEAVRPIQASPIVSSSADTHLPIAGETAKEVRLSSIARRSEAEAIMNTLAEFGGNRSATARKLGISERTLRYRLADMREAGMCVAGAGR